MVSKLSDVPPLFDPTITTNPPTDVERALSIFDQLNSFFDFDRVPEQQVAPSAPAPAPTPEPTQPSDSFVQRLADFFSGLFG